MQAWYLHAPIAIFGYLNLWNKASLRVLYVQGTNQDTVLLSHVTADDFPDTKKITKIVLIMILNTQLKHYF